MERPTKEQIAAMPPYSALPLDRVHIVRTVADCEFAERHLRRAGHVGFDTESKPTFVAGGERTGPHIVQFATTNHAFIVRTEEAETEWFLRYVLEDAAIAKVGFGLGSDRGPLYRKLGAALVGGVDLAHMVRRLGYKQAVGLKAAVAIVLGCHIPKAKKVTTSNWAAHNLSPQQVQYAANDAHASLLVYQALMAMPEVVAAEAAHKERRVLSDARRHVPSVQQPEPTVLAGSA